MSDENASPSSGASAQDGGSSTQGAASTSTESSASHQAANTPDTLLTEQANTRQTSEEASKGESASQKNNSEQSNAPAEYQFTAPEGAVFDEAVLSTYKDVAKELNLTQEAAQSILDKMAPAMAQRQQNALNQARQEWESQSKADKEFGGDALPQNLAIAKKALDTLGSPELKSLLNESGLGNHPEMVRLLYRAGKQLNEDTFVSSHGGASSKSDRATVLYDNTP